MSAPRSRRIRNQVHPTVVPKSERRIAIFGSLGIVLLTVFLIWAMRPGNFNPGTGGIVHRQPRVTWLVVLTLIGLAFAYWFPRRSTAKHKDPRKVMVWIVIGVFTSSIAAIALWSIRWDGIVRTYTPPPTFNPPTPTTKPTSTTTTKPGATTTTGANGTSTTATTATTSGSTTSTG